MNFHQFLDMCAHHEMYTGKPPETVSMTPAQYDSLMGSLPPDVFRYAVVIKDGRVVTELNGVRIMVREWWE